MQGQNNERPIEQSINALGMFVMCMARPSMLLFTKANTAGVRIVNSPFLVLGGLFSVFAFGAFSGSEVMQIMMWVAIASQIEQTVRTRSHGQHSYSIGDCFFYNLWATTRRGAWAIAAFITLSTSGIVYFLVETGEFAEKERAAAWFFLLTGLSQIAVLGIVNHRQQRAAEAINDAMIEAEEAHHRSRRMGRY